MSAPRYVVVWSTTDGLGENVLLRNGAWTSPGSAISIYDDRAFCGTILQAEARIANHGTGRAERVEDFVARHIDLGGAYWRQRAAKGLHRAPLEPTVELVVAEWRR